MLVLYDLAKGLSDHFSLADSADIISKHLRRMVPASTCVFFIYDAVSDELRSGYTTGDHASHFSGLTIPRGQRLSGWVAANLKTILNSDPVLDLGEPARSMRPRLASCLATPLMSDEQLVGVLSLYSTSRDGFTEDHRRIIEAVAGQVSKTVRNAVAFDGRREAKHKQDAFGSLPSYQHVEGFLTSELASSAKGKSLSIVLVEGSAQNGTGLDKDLTSDRLVDAISKELRGGDVLFRYRDSDFVVLLSGTDRNAAEAVAMRILKRITGPSARPEGARSPVSIGVASAPDDGANVDDLVATARRHSRSLPHEHSSGARQSIH